MKNILIRPVITEKSLGRIKNSQYTFEVEKTANKIEIKDAVHTDYKVDVLTVKTFIRKGKLKTVGKKRQEKQLSSRKFAVVKIKKEQTIDAFNQ